MNKSEFLSALRRGLTGLPPRDVEERVAFFGEMIDDRVEEGLSEEAAVAEIGDVDAVVAQIIADTPLAKLVCQRVAPKRRLGGGEIALIVAISPVWLPLLVVALSVMFALYVSLWAVVVSLWASFGVVVGGAFGAIVAGGWFALSGSGPQGVAMIAAGIVCAGLSIFLFFGCRAATKGAVLLAQKMVLRIKKRFAGKGEAV